MRVESFKIIFKDIAIKKPYNSKLSKRRVVIHVDRPSTSGINILNNVRDVIIEFLLFFFACNILKISENYFHKNIYYF